MDSHMLHHRLVRALAGLALLLVGLQPALTAPADAATKPSPSSTTVPFQRSANTGYSWWTGPVVARAPGSFYSTGVTGTGLQRVYRWSGGTMTYETIGSTKADDHNAPAISRWPGKATLVFATGHPGVMQVRRSTSDAPVLGGRVPGFGQAQTMPFERRTTYVQVLRDGDRVVVLSRYLEQGYTGWYYVRSSDSGLTWSEPTELFDSEGRQAYLLVKPHDRDPSRVHALAYWHPKTGSENRIGYRDLTFEQLWSGAAERFTVGGMDTVWQSDPAVTHEQNVRLLDAVDKNGTLFVATATWNAVQPVPVYQVSTRAVAGGDWTRRALRSAGASFGRGNGRYVPGAVFDSRPGVERIYYGYQLRAGLWRLVQGRVTPDAQVTDRIVLQDASRPLARPVSAGSDLYFQRLDRYPSFTDYTIRAYTLRLR